MYNAALFTVLWASIVRYKEMRQISRKDISGRCHSGIEEKEIQAMYLFGVDNGYLKQESQYNNGTTARLDQFSWLREVLISEYF